MYTLSSYKGCDIFLQNKNGFLPLTIEITIHAGFEAPAPENKPVTEKQVGCACGHPKEIHSPSGCLYREHPERTIGHGVFCKCHDLIETYPDRDLPTDSLDPIRQKAFKDLQ